MQMENKVSIFWTDRLASSQERLVNLCKANCQVINVPPRTLPVLLPDGTDELTSKSLAVLQCIEDGKYLVESIKDELINVSKFEKSNIKEKWHLMQQLSLTITETNNYLLAATRLYSNLQSKRLSDVHNIPIARSIGLVIIYRFLLNDVILHEQQLVAFMDKSIEVISMAKKASPLLTDVETCRSVILSRQSFSLEFDNGAIRDAVWVIKHALREPRNISFGWLFGLVSCLMIQKGNKYSSLCRDLMVKLDTKTIVSWGPYIITVTDFVKMFQLKTTDRNIQDKARNDFRKLDLQILFIKIEQSQASQLYEERDNVLSLCKTVLLGSAKLGRQLPKWFNSKFVSAMQFCGRVEALCNTTGNDAVLFGRVSKQVSHLMSILKRNKKCDSKTIKTLTLGLALRDIDMIETALACVRRTAKTRSIADQIYGNMAKLRQIANNDKSFLAGSVVQFECFINLFSGSNHDIKSLSAFLHYLTDCKY